MDNKTKKCGRPPKKVVIDDNVNTNLKNIRVVDVSVKKIRNKSYFIDDDNYVYSINNHILLGVLYNGDISFYTRELKQEIYID